MTHPFRGLPTLAIIGMVFGLAACADSASGGAGGRDFYGGCCGRSPYFGFRGYDRLIILDPDRGQPIEPAVPLEPSLPPDVGIPDFGGDDFGGF